MSTIGTVKDARPGHVALIARLESAVRTQERDLNVPNAERLGISLGFDHATAELDEARRELLALLSKMDDALAEAAEREKRVLLASDGALGFRLLDGSTVACNCIRSPYSWQVAAALRGEP